MSLKYPLVFLLFFSSEIHSSQEREDDFFHQVKLLKEQYSLSGEGVTIIVQDDFDPKANGFNHGKAVKYCAQKVAPNTTFVECGGNDFELMKVDSPSILTCSTNPALFEDTGKSIRNFYLYTAHDFYLDLARQGTSIIFFCRERIVHDWGERYEHISPPDCQPNQFRSLNPWLCLFHWDFSPF